MMFIVTVELDAIVANPWQPRTGEDAQHIKDLALSIAQDGLMQLPVGRLIDANGEPCSIQDALHHAGVFNSLSEAWSYIFSEMGVRVQLAFGHSRLAAYKWLRDDPSRPQSGPQGAEAAWTQMTVVLRDISDHEMFRMGVSENLQRKDLSPIEEAQAMGRYRDEFGKSSAEIGELFGLAESSVRNKIRLLGLPEEIQTALRDGSISEGAARELLRLYDLPAELQKSANMLRDPYSSLWNGTVSIVKKALEGWTAEQVRSAINRIILDTGANLHAAEWKWDEDYDLSMNLLLKAANCKSCEFKVVVEGKTYCTQQNCFFAKREIWIKRRLAMASAACGIQTPDDIHNVGKIEVAAEVRSSGCANLRVVYDSSIPRVGQQDSRVPGFEDVKIVCGNRNNICTCANGLRAAQLADAKRQNDYHAAAALSARDANPVTAVIQQAKQETPAGEPVRLNSEDLRAAAREERQAQRQAVEELKAMREQFAKRIQGGLMNCNRLAWFMVLDGSRYKLEHQRAEIASFEETAYEAGLRLAGQIYTYWSGVDLARAEKEFNDILSLMDLIPLRTAIVNEPEQPMYVPVEDVPHSMPGQLPGETLVDYFARTDQE